MAAYILAGGVIVIGLYVASRIVPKVPDVQPIITTGSLEIEKTKEIGIANVGKTEVKEQAFFNPETQKIEVHEQEVQKTYGQCVTDANCQGDALFGARYRCIGGMCTPLATSESGILYNPNELKIASFCGKKFLLGDGSPCTYDSQCSTSGVTCDLKDSSCVFAGPATKTTYCNQRSGKCAFKTNPDWLGITWKQEDIPAETARNLGSQNKQQENKTAIEILSKNNNCSELLSMKPV